MADHPVAGDGGGPDGEVIPPATEEIHLPGPSYLPVVVAFGVTIALVGIVISFVMLVVGLVITAVAVGRWLREVREEMAELPLEH